MKAVSYYSESVITRVQDLSFVIPMGYKRSKIYISTWSISLIQAYILCMCIYMSELQSIRLK